MVDIKRLRDAYQRGENITQKFKESGLNTLQGIEVAYDLQSGGYVQGVYKDLKGFKAYTSEMGEILKDHVCSLDSVLDCGTGELTTLSGISHYLPNDIELLAFDLSLSRINVGRRFAARAMRGDLAVKLRTFVAAIDRIPLPDKSVNVVMTSHSLEPNFGREQQLLQELLRVSCRKVILFEPSWENNTDDGRSRMERLGYIRDLPKHIEAAGGYLKNVFPLQNISNPLNPTNCYIIEVSQGDINQSKIDIPFVCPISGEHLNHFGNYLWSESGGYAYPIIEGIPILRDKYAILMTLK